MNINKPLIKIFALSLLCLAACGKKPGEPQSEPDPVKPVLDVPLNCSASLTRARMPYTIKGDSLSLGPAGSATPMKRLAAGEPGRPVYGTWLVTDQVTAGIHILGKLQIAPASISLVSECSYGQGRSGTAKVSSPATITDSEIEILQEQKQTIPFDEPEDEAGEPR